MSALFPDIPIMGFPISRCTRAAVGEAVVRELDAGRGGWVFTPNLDILRQLTTKPEYAAMCRAATIRTADGMPLLWAAKLQGTPLPERVSGSDMAWSVTEAAAKAGKSIYFFGGNPGVAEQAARILQERYAGLKVAGIECPPFGFEKDREYMAGWVQRLRDANPDIVYVALSSPKQDHTIVAVRDQLPKTWFLGIGISFSFVAGDVRRAPTWMQRLGLEWFFRLTQEPKKLFRRYVIDGFPFTARLLASSVMHRGRVSPPVPR